MINKYLFLEVVKEHVDGMDNEYVLLDIYSRIEKFIALKQKMVDENKIHNEIVINELIKIMKELVIVNFNNYVLIFFKMILLIIFKQNILNYFINFIFFQLIIL